MNWIIENKEQVVTIASAVVAIASSICALTDTKDRWWYRIIEIAALNIGKAKDNIKSDDLID
jgi:hypothetical protein